MSLYTIESAPTDQDPRDGISAILRNVHNATGTPGEGLKTLYTRRYLLLTALGEGALIWDLKLATNAGFRRAVDERVPVSHGVIATTVAVVNKQGLLAVEATVSQASSRVIPQVGYRVPLAVMDDRVLFEEVDETFVLEHAQTPVLNREAEISARLEALGELSTAA